MDEFGNQITPNGEISNQPTTGAVAPDEVAPNEQEQLAIAPKTEHNINYTTPETAVSETAEPAVTEPPVPELPTSEPPIQELPVSESPVPELPVSEPPIQELPVSEPPVSELPVSEPPVSESPVSEPLTAETTEMTVVETTDYTEAVNTDTGLSGVTERLDAAAEKAALADVKKSRFKRVALIAAIVSILGGSALGFGIGVAIPITEKYLIPRLTGQEQQSTNPFPFTDINWVMPVGTFSQDMPDYTYGYADIVSLIEPSVVRVVSKSAAGETTSIYGFSIPTPTEGEGSGVLFHADNEKFYIVTNYHVVEGATGVEIYIGENGPFAAKMVGKNATSDISVISISSADVKASGIENVTLATFGDSDTVRVGDEVLAIGNALGEGNSATNGIISAINKSIKIDRTVEYDAFQTNAAINPGNSGGPLVNLKGEIVGINSSKLSSTISSSANIEGMGYSIPSNDVKALVEEIMGPQKPVLGIRGGSMTAELAEQFNLPQAGAYISEVIAGSTAETAGLKAGDIITGFNGRTIFAFEDLQEAVSECKLGDSVEIKYISNGNDYKTATAVMMAAPDETF